MPITMTATRGVLRHHITTTLRRYGQPSNPFRVLGVPPTASFETVRKRFLRLALQHHPDTTDDVASGDIATFVRMRQAFEQIRDLRRPRDAMATSDRAVEWTETDFLVWFFQETGYKLNSIQRRDLIRLHRNRIPGAKYDGQHWELARRVSDAQDLFFWKMDNEGGPPPIHDDLPTGQEVERRTLRRRRRR